MNQPNNDLNEQARLAWKIIETTNTNLFLTGKAGTGKTTFLRRLKNESSKRIVVVAPTGIAAINAEGAKLAKEIVENELVMGTDAYQNGRIVYLAHPAVWYTAEGGVTALDLMLQDLEAELLK